MCPGVAANLSCLIPYLDELLATRLWKKYHGAFKPNAVSLTTDKPVTCSHALPGHAARRANDGWSFFRNLLPKTSW